MLCPPTSSQAALEEKMNVWVILIRKTTLGGNSSQPTYLPTYLSHTGLPPELQPLFSCSHPQSAIQIFGTGKSDHSSDNGYAVYRHFIM